MGTEQVEARTSGAERREFMRYLLRDLQAVEQMLEARMFESGIRRVGAEQEVFLIDAGFHASPIAMELLRKLNAPGYTTELGAFNFECNLDPQVLVGDALSRMERELTLRLERMSRAANGLGSEILLTGILPTLRKSDLGLENMTPIPRYRAINDALTRMRGGEYEFLIRGQDELRLRHDSVMVEACNTSFQLHLQVTPEEFPNFYNIAQLVAGPVLACATNSPLLFGRRLWAETRIALFQQAVDTRDSGAGQREMSPRVTFGTRWVRKSVTEIFREDIARFRTLVSTELDEDPIAMVARGEAPQLKALRLHNGTVYRWNRACYGITDGKPHLRIENRVFPSGPSVPDEIGNAALWFGLVLELAHQHEDITRVVEFEQAQRNFVSAAREGLGTHLTWLEGMEMPAQQLALEHLIPLADAGLERAGISSADRSRYLGIVEQRVRLGRTGSRWMLHSLVGMKQKGTPAERLNALTAAILIRQRTSRPVAEWEPARLEEGGGWKHNYMRVEQYMTTDLVTVHAEDPVDLVANLMEWHKIRHVLVEDDQHRLVGLVSYRAVLRLLAEGRLGNGAEAVPVSEVMRRDPVKVSPQLPTLRAIAIMREFGIGCLPVLDGEKLVGVVTEHDFMDIAREMLEQKLRE